MNFVVELWALTVLRCLTLRCLVVDSVVDYPDVMIVRYSVALLPPLDVITR